MYAGAAARAAAAAQNEQMELARLEMAKMERDLIKNLSDVTLTQDSESGIGIDLRDDSELTDTELDIIRIGMIICKSQLNITVN
jgi:F-box and WD-40 domain protein 1/11